METKASIGTSVRDTLVGSAHLVVAGFSIAVAVSFAIAPVPTKVKVWGVGMWSASAAVNAAAGYLLVKG